MKVSDVPHWGKNNIIQQIVVQFFGHPQACPLHGHWCGQTQHDTQTAKQAEHQQVWRVTETNVLWGEQGGHLKNTNSLGTKYRKDW